MKTKKFLSIVLAVLMLISAVPLTVNAETYSGTCGAQGDNVTWEIDVNQATLFINGTGDMADYEEPSDAPWYEYRYSPGLRYIVVGEGVTSVGDYAFRDTNAEITLSATVKELGICSFYGYVFIDENNPYLKRDNYGVIYSEDGKTLLYASKFINFDYTLPEGVEEIAPYSFVCAAESFLNIDTGEMVLFNIPSSIKKISINAFFSIDYSEHHIIPRFCVEESNPYYSSDEHGVLYDNNKEILYMAPIDTRPIGYELKNYILPETVKELSDYAFYGYDLSRDGICLVTENVTKIGSYSFSPLSYNYEPTHRLYIPKSVTSLADDFAGDSELLVYYAGTQKEWEALYQGDKDLITVFYEHNHVNDTVTETCTQRLHTCISCKTTNAIEDIGDNHDWQETFRNFDFPCQGGTAYYHCDKCRTTKEGYIEPTDEHSWIGLPTDAIYCAGGIVHWWCECCPATKDEYIEPKGHLYQFVYDNNATCTEDGTKHEYCPRCGSIGETITVEGSKLGHDLTETTVLSVQTCSQDGISVQACKRCSEITAITESAYGHYDNDKDGKCDDCSCLLERTDNNVPEEPQESTNILTRIIEFFNKIINIFKNLFKI